MPEPRPHNFTRSKAWASCMAELPWLEGVYRRAFPNFESMSIVRSDGWAQRGGIDRKINLKSARSVFIEEKFRKEDYRDFFLERWSDKHRQKPGWIQQDLLCDFVAYVFVPSRRVFLLPYLELRRAWLKHGRRWIRTYRLKDAENDDGYTTEGVCVPIPVVQKALVEGEFFQADAIVTSPERFDSEEHVFDFGAGKVLRL
jgi:hypothetical protein